PIASSRWNASFRNVRVSLKWQLYDTKPLANEDCGSVLPDVAERAKEVIPVQHRWSTHIPCAHRSAFFAEHPSDTPHSNRLLIAVDRYIPELDRNDILADRLDNNVRYQELPPEFLVEALDSGGQIHRVADHGVFLAPRRADVDCHHVPKMQAYADTQRPITAD